MPNNTETLIKIEGKLEHIIKLLKNHTHQEEETPYLDFDTIIPEPKTPEECALKMYVIHSEQEAKEKHLAWNETDPRRWFNWYEWRIDNWGTKWGAYDCSIPKVEELIDINVSDNKDSLDIETEIEMIVYTAWSPAIPVYQKLQEMYPDLEITVYYLDEGWFYAGILRPDSSIDETGDLDIKNPNDIFDEVMTVLNGEDWQSRYNEDEEEC